MSLKEFLDQMVYDEWHEEYLRDQRDNTPVDGFD